MNNILLALKGAIFGIANVIPGVSGGTIALTMGVYEDLISSISHFFKNPKQSLKFLIPFSHYDCLDQQVYAYEFDCKKQKLFQPMRKMPTTTITRSILELGSLVLYPFDASYSILGRYKCNACSTTSMVGFLNSRTSPSKFPYILWFSVFMPMVLA